jgi:hypothetical protein
VMGVTTRTVAMGEESSGGTREKTNQTGTLCNGWQRWVISTQLHKLLKTGVCRAPLRYSVELELGARSMFLWIWSFWS